MADTQNPQEEEKPWWAVYPAAKAQCPGITTKEVMKLFDDMDITPEPRSFLLVDVRRADWEVSCIQHCDVKTRY